MQVCKLCNINKLASDYYASNRTQCKECIKARARKHRALRIDHYRAYDRDRGNRQSPEYLREYRKKNRLKYAAHVKLNNSMRGGHIAKEPCEICGDIKVHAHHDDYSKPLDVRWLCAAHHRQWHVENGEAKGNLTSSRGRE